MRFAPLITVVLCGVSAAVGFGLYRLLIDPADTGTQSIETVTDALPAAAIKLTALDGATVTLDDWQGQWRIPVLVDAQTRWQDRNLQILGPAMDPRDRAAEMAERFAINYPVFYGNEAIASAASALGDTLGALPYSVLIDPEGTIRFQKHGEFDAVELEQLLKTHLGAP